MDPFPIVATTHQYPYQYQYHSRNTAARQTSFDLPSSRNPYSYNPPERFSTELRRAISPSIMNGNDAQGNHAEGGERPNQSQAGSSSPAMPFNPLTNAAHEPVNSTIGNSVVRDLMRVYESLTQSSTPQISSMGQQQQAEPQKLDLAQQPPPGYDSQQLPPHSYNPHLPQHPQLGSGAPIQLPASYNIPPPVYHIPPQSQYPPQPQQQGGPPQPPYYAEAVYSQQNYMVPPPEHQPQHGYPVQGHEQQQQPQQAELQQLPPPEQEEEDGSESEEQPEPTGRPKRKRRGSNNSNSESSGVQVGRGVKGRKKSKASDGRWSKRFTWPEDLHRDFVSAIFDVGLKHSSPSTILEHMPSHEQVTTERIKSHLQKYRLHRVKSKKEFLSSFESSLQNYQTNGDDGANTVACGEVAAQLTYTALKESSSGKGAISAGSSKPTEITNTADEIQADTPEDIIAHQQQQNSDALMLPQLTEAEKASPIGAAMGYLMGLFFSLKQQLMIQRALEAGADEKDKGNASPVQDVFNSFVAGSVPSAAPVGAAEYSGDPLLQHQQQPFDASGLGAIKPAAAQSVRTNIEENSMMKREMQNQMALQNKMRALKQQELNKYKNVHSQQEYKEEGNKMPSDSQSPLPTKEDEETAKASEAAASRGQGAGETPGNDGVLGGRQHQRGLSIGASEEFWNTDVVDEQLFEFLMNN